MKYTIELTDKQKKVMDCLLEIIHRYIGFNPKFEMYREPEVIIKTVTDPNADAIYEQGFEDGKNEVIHKTELIPQLKKAEYNRGLEDARQTMLELIETPSSEWGLIFGEDDYYLLAIVKHNSIAEINDKIKAYKEKTTEINDHHFIVDSLRNLIDDYGVEKVAKALPEFGIIAESEG